MRTKPRHAASARRIVGRDRRTVCAVQAQANAADARAKAVAAVCVVPHMLNLSDGVRTRLRGLAFAGGGRGRGERSRGGCRGKVQGSLSGPIQSLSHAETKPKAAEEVAHTDWWMHYGTRTSTGAFIVTGMHRVRGAGDRAARADVPGAACVGDRRRAGHGRRRRAAGGECAVCGAGERA